MAEEEKDYTSTVVFTFIHEKQGYGILDTTDNRTLADSLHYSGGDREIYVGRKIRLDTETAKLKRFVISGIVVHYFEEKLMNRTVKGQSAPYNNQIIVYVVDDEDSE